MASLTGRYNPEAEPQQDLGKLPTGEYVARIIDSDVKPTSTNDGEFLELTYEVMEGPCKGRRHWERITLDNPNAKAVEIGQRQLASVREATGVMNPRDSAEFHNKPHVIRIEFHPAGSEYQYGKRKGQTRDRDEAEIRAWKRMDAAGGMGNAPSSASPQPSAAATPASPSSAPAANAAPWRRTA